MNTQELFFKLLGFQSLTPKDDGAFDFIKAYLADFNVIEVNILKRLKISFYTNDLAKVFIFVLQVISTLFLLAWVGKVSLFNPILKEGVVYARGAQDMKSGVCAF